MKKILSALLLSCLAANVAASDTYGYLAFWQNPKDSNDVMQIKTTQENASQSEATAELENFCKGQDALVGVGENQPTGCKSVIPMQNTCVAVAYPKAESQITPENAVVITSPRFNRVHQFALNQCMKRYGSQGQCALETVYCTASDYYGGTVKTLLNRLK